MISCKVCPKKTGRAPVSRPNILCLIKIILLYHKIDAYRHWAVLSSVSVFSNKGALSFQGGFYVLLKAGTSLDPLCIYH